MGGELRRDGDDLWFEVSSATWKVGYRLVAQGADLVAGELRLQPVGEVPPGGVTSELLQAIRVGADRRAWREEAQSEAVFSAETWTAMSTLVDELRAIKPREGRDAYYAFVGALYEQEVNAGNTRPVVSLARALERPPAFVRDVLDDARKRGLLTRPRAPGRPGGRLTAKGRRILGREVLADAAETTRALLDQARRREEG